MIELRNRQYATIIDCIAGENLEQGNVITLVNHSDAMLRAMKATSSGDVSTVLGPMVAHWINDRSSAVAYSGAADGLALVATGASDDDAIHYIPSGARMLAVGGKGVTEIRFDANSLDSEFAGGLPAAGTTLKFSSDESKLCSGTNGSAVDLEVGFVVENDGATVAVLLG